MNSQQLLAISNSLAEELQAVNQFDSMHTWPNQLRDAINSPSEETQRGIQTTGVDIETKLREAKSNSMRRGMVALWTSMFSRSSRVVISLS